MVKRSTRKDKFVKSILNFLSVTQFLNLVFYNIHKTSFSAVYNMHFHGNPTKNHSERGEVGHFWLKNQVIIFTHWFTKMCFLTINCYSEQIRTIFLLLVRLSSKSKERIHSCVSFHPSPRTRSFKNWLVHNTEVFFTLDFRFKPIICP